MPRRKSAKTVLKEALESGDNLEILKAHRRLIVEDMINVDEEEDRRSLHSSLTQINKEIVKLEGLKRSEDSRTPEARKFAGMAGNLMKGTTE